MVNIDSSRNQLLTDFGRATLFDRYLLPGEDYQDAFARASIAFASNKKHAQRMYDYVSKLWMMFSTPILSNGGTEKGLPISCYLNMIGDSRKDILQHYEENAWLASMGGGVGGDASALRSNGTSTSSGGASTGLIPFLHVVDSEMLAFSQGVTRRGSYAAYLDISHPEIEEFIGMRKPSGGDINRKNLNLHHGINISDAFMEAVLSGRDWNLIDPHTKKTTKVLDARLLWQVILETRVATGEPYLHFADTSNKYLPIAQQLLGLKIRGSNLCSEIMLATALNRTAVCCLSSVNLEKFDEWESNELFIPDLIEFLDNVISFFIKKAPKVLWRATYSAGCERSLGLGAMGFHSYLQNKGIPFEGPLASGINRKMFKHIKEQAIEKTKSLAVERGACPDSNGEPYYVRNMHLLAVAPNASSSIICGTTSPSIEPFRANAFTHKTMSGSFLVKNPALENTLKKYKQNTDKVWSKIITSKGSIQDLGFIDEWDKSIFKTAIELDQNWIIQHASDRQPYICQGQSVNLFFNSNVDVSYLNEVHLNAWKKGLKSLYYLRSESIQRSEVVNDKIERVKKEDPSNSEEEECFSCQG